MIPNKTYPLVSIITINYNQPKVTAEWLHSIRNITYPAYEIIIVDNASTQDTLEEYIPDFTNVLLIKSLENKGFAGGNNLGVQYARGEFILFINNDTEVEANFLELLVDCMRSNSNIGMVSPKIKYYYNKNIIQYVGGGKINAFTGRGKFKGHGEQDTNKYTLTEATELIHGAALLVSRTVISNVGLMDEAYFLYYEELDWCERAKKSGYLMYVVGGSVIYHKESMSVGKSSPLRMFYITRNRILFMRKNRSKLSFFIYLWFFICISIPKSVVQFLLQRRFDLLQAFIKGILWHLPFKWKEFNFFNSLSIIYKPS